MLSGRELLRLKRGAEGWRRFISTLVVDRVPLLACPAVHGPGREFDLERGCLTKSRLESRSVRSGSDAWDGRTSRRTVHCWTSQPWHTIPREKPNAGHAK
jgi:hypothetical protein